MTSWRQSYSKYKEYFLNIAIFYRKREDVKAFLEILLSLGAITVFALAAIRPTLTTIAELIRDMEEKQKVLQTMETKIQALTKAQSLYNQNLESINLLNTAIPEGPEPHTAVRQIEGTIQNNSGNIIRIQADEATILGTEQTSNYIEATGSATLPTEARNLRLTANISQNYPQLLSLLQSLEKLRRPLLFNEISLLTLPEENQLVLTTETLIPYIYPEKTTQ